MKDWTFDEDATWHLAVSITRTPRQQKELEIMNWLNEHQRQGTNAFYDCGELGTLHIFWYRSTWRTEWITIEVCPEWGAE